MPPPASAAHREHKYQMDTLGCKPAGDGQPNADTPPGDGRYVVLQTKVYRVWSFPSER